MNVIVRFVIWLMTKTVFPLVLYVNELSHGFIVNLLRKTVKRGKLVVKLPNDEVKYVFGGHGASAASGECKEVEDDDKREDLVADLTIVNPKFFWRCMLAQDIGFAESYMNEEWETTNLTKLLRVLAVNTMNTVSIPFAFHKLFNIINHWSRNNSIANSKQNISDHYDLSNEFFQLILDPTMMYSSAIFPSAIQSASDDGTGKNTDNIESLSVAQMNKLNTIIDLARLKSDHHLLEIGTGWGSLAITAAKRIGCKVTSITLSTEQLQFAKQRVKEAGLEHLIDIQLCDYRSFPGKSLFDSVISIEMIEAVGEEYYPIFFKTIDRLLKPNGIVVIQAITIPDQRFYNYKTQCDFIQKYIFPGGLLPSVTALQNAMTDHTSLVIEELKNYPIHYHRTLEVWAEQLNRNAEKIKSLEKGGFDDRFIRMWNYYFSYCSAGFAERSINLVHLTLTRERNTKLI